MRIRSIAASIAAASIIGGGAFALGSGTAANASGTTTETVSQVNTMLNTKCYEEVRTERVYYTHSSTHGWVREPSVKTEVTRSEHCYAK